MHTSFKDKEACGVVEDADECSRRFAMRTSHRFHTWRRCAWHTLQPFECLGKEADEVGGDEADLAELRGGDISG